MDKNYSTPYGAYNNYYSKDGNNEEQNKRTSRNQKQEQLTDSNDSNEPINIKIDKKGKGHEKNESVHYGFIGSSSSTKYSNPYDNNAYGEFNSKKEKRNSKKAGKKRNSTEQLESPPSDIDVTQAPLTNGTAAVPVVYYTTPQQISTVPTVYYTTPVATPVAIQYVNSPVAYQEGSNSSESDLNKEKRESRKYTSYYGDKENAEEDIMKSENKQKELEEIMNELGMKPKKDEPKDLKSRLIRNQLTIGISLLVLFVLLIALYFLWPRVLDITITEFTLQDDEAIQYKLPITLEGREAYTDLTNVTSSDTDSFVRFNLITHCDVRNNNYIPYKFNSLVIDYVLKSDVLRNNVLLGRSYVDNISFGARKNTRMTITTALEYAAQSMKKDDTFNYLLDRCGITTPGSPMDIDYKVTMKIPVISTIYHPSYTKETSFQCPFLMDNKYKVVEKKKEDEDEKHDDNGDKKNDGDNKNNDGDKKGRWRWKTWW